MAVKKKIYLVHEYEYQKINMSIWIYSQSIMAPHFFENGKNIPLNMSSRFVTGDQRNYKFWYMVHEYFLGIRNQASTIGSQIVCNSVTCSITNRDYRLVLPCDRRPVLRRRANRRRLCEHRLRDGDGRAGGEPPCCPPASGRRARCFFLLACRAPGQCETTVGC